MAVIIFIFTSYENSQYWSGNVEYRGPYLINFIVASIYFSVEIISF
jgi:hypothetical protein